jgi:hypothetical protein
VSSGSSPLAELLAALGGVFTRLGLRWYLFGAQAAILHGAARLTADVDVTVHTGEHSASALAAALEAAGFALRVPDVDRFVERTRVLPLVHTASAMPVDVVLAGPGLEEVFLSRAQARTVGQVAVPVVSPEDLVAMKILAGRPKDLEDAIAVLRAQANHIVVERVRTTLALLERALDRKDLIPELERALLHVRRASQ